jgi:hypothetical protein
MPNCAPQHAVHRPHDELHHGFGRVVDAAHLAQGGVIRREEVLVEMHHGVFASRAFAEVLQDGGHLGAFQQAGEVVQQPLQFGFQRVGGQRAE